jgi:hypothetical protein
MHTLICHSNITVDPVSEAARLSDLRELFVLEAFMTEPYLSNPESNCLVFVDMFTKLCLKSGCHLVGVDSAVPEKSNDHSLIILPRVQILHNFSRPEWKNSF